ncbi:MAG: hypothetical protein WDN45_10605 [Caulobacteraceae bacterium]
MWPSFVVLALIAPVVVWNAQHQWISFTFQAGRGAAHRFDPAGLLTALVAEAGLLTPWLAVPLVWSVVRAIRSDDPKARFLLLAAAPTIVLFIFCRWSGPRCCRTGRCRAGCCCCRCWARPWRGSTRTWPRRWAVGSAAALLVLWGLAVSDAATAWITDAIPKLKTDPTAEAMDWSRLRTELGRRGLLKPGTLVVAAEWNEAGKIDQAVGDVLPVLVFNADPREYAFRTPSSAYPHHDALIVGKPTTVKQELPKIAPHFASLTPACGCERGARDQGRDRPDGGGRPRSDLALSPAGLGPMSARDVTCWWITNGAAGFRTQARGAGRSRDPRGHREDGGREGALVAGAAGLVAPDAAGAGPCKDRLQPPWPDVVVSCGAQGSQGGDRHQAGERGQDAAGAHPAPPGAGLRIRPDHSHAPRPAAGGRERGPHRPGLARRDARGSWRRRRRRPGASGSRICRGP